MRVLKALSAAALLVLVLASLRASLGDSANLLMAGSVIQGEALLHAAHEPFVDVTHRLPLNPLLEALLALHAPPWAAALASASFALVLLLAVLALGTGLA